MEQEVKFRSGQFNLDLKRISGIVKGDFEYHEIPDMTHLLRPETGEPSISNYEVQVKQPLDLRMLQFVGSLLDRHASDRPVSRTVDNNRP